MVAAPNVAVAVQPLPRPVISSSLGTSPPAGPYPVLCPASTATFSTTVAGANSYTWTATGGLGVGSPGATTLTTSSASITVYPGSGTGQGTITVAATNTTVSSCASPVSVAYNLVYGGPAAHNGTLRMHSNGNNFDYESNCPYGCAGVCSGSSITMSPGDPNPGVLLDAVWKAYRVDVSPAQLVSTQTFTGSAANNSFLYLSLSGAPVGSRYEVQLQERNACGPGPLFTYQLEVINCAGGEEPFFTAPGQPAAESVAAYPNPADRALTLEQSGGPVVLRTPQGKVVHSQVASPGRLRLDTSRLPAGLYFLELRNAKGQPVRRQLRIAH